MKFHKILGNNWLYSFEADPSVTLRDGIFYLYSHDWFGVKEYFSLDGIKFTFNRYIVLGGYRPYINNTELYYEKFTQVLKFPNNPSQLRVRDLVTGKDRLISDVYHNHCSPSVIQGNIFFSTGYRKMDYGWNEPTLLTTTGGHKLQGLENITSLREFEGRFFGTQIDSLTGKSTAKIVECHVLDFPTRWEIGRDILTPDHVSSGATHVYIASIIGQRLYFNVRFGRNRFSSEKIYMTELQ